MMIHAGISQGYWSTKGILRSSEYGEPDRTLKVPGANSCRPYAPAASMSAAPISFSSRACSP